MEVSKDRLDKLFSDYFYMLPLKSTYSMTFTVDDLKKAFIAGYKQASTGCGCGCKAEEDSE